MAFAASWLAGGVAHASDHVRVKCPGVERERLAEIESRARASLLLVDLEADVSVVCGDDYAVVEASTGDTRASVRAPTGPATLVDDVLAGVDQALGELHESVPPTAPDGARRAPAVAASPRAPVAPSRSSGRTEADAAPSLRVEPTRARPVTLLAASAALEAWSSRGAAGLALMARRGGAPLWLGLGAGVFRPLNQDAHFDVTEVSLDASLTFEPTFARGLCLTLRGGPSWLWTVPDTRLAVRSHTLGAAFVADAELSWPLWRGRTAVMPALGVRWFSVERGVRLDEVERFTLGGFVPRIALGLVHRFD